MQRVFCRGTAVVALIAALAVPGLADPPDGNALLRESARMHPLPQGYAVPIHFNVHFHRPIGFTGGANAILYFRAPDKSALVITNVPQLIARQIASSYSHIEVAPQQLIKKYNVTGVSDVDFNGGDAYQLYAVPNYQGVSHALFMLRKSDLSAVGAQWFFSDGSSVEVSVRNQQVGSYLLPAHEDLDVIMPSFAVSASGETGTYDLKADVPDSVFSQ